MTLVSPFDLTGPLPTGRTAIEASAGTGKTYTLAALCTRYVAERGVPIDRILVVTFTRAAAAELRDRIRARIAGAAAALTGDADLDDDLLRAIAAQTPGGRAVAARRLEQAVVDFDTATITTIHGFAQQVRTALGTTAPGDLDADLDDDTRVLVAQVCTDLLAAAVVGADAASVETLPSLDRLTKTVTFVLGNPGIAAVPAPAPASGDDPGAAPDPAAAAARLVHDAVDAVHRRRRAAGRLAFDDLITELRDALENGDAAVALLRDRFAVALIDEFQDTDPVQWAIFSRVFGTTDESTLVLVGDPKQAIYAFRGADIHTYLAAAHAEGTTRATLGINQRSDGAALTAVQRLLDGATFGDDRITFLPVEPAERHADQRITDTAGTPLPALTLRTAVGPHVGRANGAKDTQTGSAVEAIAVDLAEHVVVLLSGARIPDGQGGDRPVRPGDVAVLVGQHRESPIMQAALRDRGVPAVVTRGGNVLESAAATQWTWLLSALTRPADPARARTAATSWFVGWTADEVAAADDDALTGVQTTLARWADVLEAHGALEFCRVLWAESGVVARVLARADGDRELTDLEHVAELVMTCTDGTHPTAAGVQSALTSLREATDADEDDDLTARRIESDAESVQILTVYAAKGLEYPVVCVPTLWKGSYARAKQTVYLDPATGVRTIDVASGHPWPSARDQKARKELAKVEAVGGNLRLLYVALTRARHQTVVWWSPAKEARFTGLGRVLFARSDGGIDPKTFAAAPKLPPVDATLNHLRTTFPPDDVLSIDETVAEPSATVWADPERAGSTGADLAVATLDRRLPRDRRRWSFTGITARQEWAHPDPADPSIGDAGAGDEPVEAVTPAPGVPAEPGTSDLPLGAIPGSKEFGILVHEVFERLDFTAPDADLDAHLAELIARRRGVANARVDAAVLCAGLRAAIESPLGPCFGDGVRLRDLAPADRLAELSFECTLATGGAAATDRTIGALVCAHLDPGDPMRPWAERLAAGLFDVDLAGHLTGSIDAVFRITDPATGEPRFVAVDYKSNLLRGPDRVARSTDYAPDRLPAAMAEHHYPLQALIYLVVVHRYLRWRLPGYDPHRHLGGAAYLFVRGMTGPDTPVVDGHPHGVCTWMVPPTLVVALSDLLDGRHEEAT
jgi:exodeoxyribonuclease V beta subunit